MSQNNQNPNQFRRQSTIWDVATNFHYNPASPESWVRLGAQVAIAGMAITLVKSLDGSTCGRGWNIWVPQTWSIPAGCFTRGLVKNVPDTFLEGQTANPQTPDQVLQPGTIQPTPSPSPVTPR